MENIKDLKSNMAKTIPENHEGDAASASNAFLWAALGSLAASFSLKLLIRNPALAARVGVPIVLLFGIYKLVRQTGRDSK